ncbi:restriction endonuclease [Paeniglutamicibacter sp.]|uniref:restriction endonuclease n=1 Tax=Paeniglutamicibacter sp. TaxID=1934391 RepID=UPI003988D03F
MTRVEWTRLEGADVEAVVAMFLNREHPRSTRITPSRGDGGVDILDRGAGPNGSDVVYQVKRYTEPLGAREKTAVEDSLKTLMKDPRWNELTVEEWHLVLPWDPSAEAEKWLCKIGVEQGVTAIWNGLTWVETLASKYPSIIDYYLHGGRSRIHEAYEVVSAAFGAENTKAELSVAALQERVSKALLTLEDDPHYRYEHRFGSGSLPEPSSRPNLVLHFASQSKRDGRWSVVDVIARCAASTTERPITVRGTLTMKSGSEAANAFQDFIAYGSPFQSPEGAYTGDLDAPGGLSGPINRATVSAWSPNEDLGRDPELHCQIVTPDGKVLAAVDLDRIDRSRGEEGLRAVFQETNGVFNLEHRFNLLDKSALRRLTFHDLTGKPVTRVVSALTFLTHCCAPNFGRISRRYTPPDKGIIDANMALPWPKETHDRLKQMNELIALLASLQNSSEATIKVPDFALVHESQPRSWLIATKLLSGESVTQIYEEGYSLRVDLEGAPLPEGSFEVSVPLEVIVGEQHVELGQVLAYFETPTCLGSQEINGRTLFELQTPHRRIKYRPLSVGSAE